MSIIKGISVKFWTFDEESYENSYILIVSKLIKNHI